MFKAKSGSFTFQIGKLTVSVGFTPSHYCSNQVYTGKIVPAPSRHDPTQLVTSENAEVAVITKKGKFITNIFFECGHDQVAGWVTPQEFIEGLQKVITFTEIRKKPKTKPITMWQVKQGINDPHPTYHDTQKEASDTVKNMIESWKALYPAAEIDIKESEGLISQAIVQVKNLHDITLFVEQVQQTKKPKTKPVTMWQIREGIDWNRQYYTQQEASDAAKNMIESWKALYPTAQIDIKESEGLVSQATIQVKDLHDVTLFVEQVQQTKNTKE